MKSLKWKKFKKRSSVTESVDSKIDRLYEKVRRRIKQSGVPVTKTTIADQNDVFSNNWKSNTTPDRVVFMEYK